MPADGKRDLGPFERTAGLIMVPGLKGAIAAAQAAEEKALKDRVLEGDRVGGGDDPQRDEDQQQQDVGQGDAHAGAVPEPEVDQT